jgi:hypothetical protein
MGRKKHYLAPETVDCEEYDEFSPSAPPSFTTGTIPLQYRESSHYLSECHASHIFFHLFFFLLLLHLCVGRKKQNQTIPKKERKQKSSLLDCPPL